ncbi:type IV secretion system protein VirB10 [Kingella negevensis]|uniref:type IV secretion system protein VirB10 n=1 Tax=Kingella negevensis TaxID=1522312 RepID=UPI002542AC07|nr:type IV secretion system protein VirB10 [Kingella negevensis]WII94066.1 type IV secretion system protein VirB10 [Kingella negevensis]
MLKKFLNRKKEVSNLPEPDFRQPENAENSIENTEPTPLSEQINDVNVEAGLPLNSSGGKNNMTKVAVVGVGLLGVGMAVAGLIAFSGSSNEDEAVAAKQQELERVKNTQSKDFSTEKLDFGQEEIATASAPVAASAASAPEPRTVPPIDTVEAPPPQPTNTVEATPETQAAPVAEPKEPPIDSRLLGDVLVSNQSSDMSGQTVSGSFEQGETQNVSFSESSSESSDNPPAQNSFAARLNPTVTPSVKAQRRADVTYLLAKGTNIPCTLDTQIITTQAGITRCLVTKDVYSANGKVLLLERGTKIIGEQTIAMLHGQARVFVLWNEAETPKGVKVSLASGGAGQLGASGHGARMKYHFWQRFGGAVMISLIGDLGDYYSNRSQSNGQNISFENSSEAAQEMATEALKNSINIPPTGFINHGTLINVMVARDVDFGGVYEVVKPYEMF